jgi:hypothetical protein
LGIAIAPNDKNPNELVIGVAAHDGTYSIDYAVHTLRTHAETDAGPSDTSANKVADRVSSSDSISSTASSVEVLAVEDFVVRIVEAYGRERLLKVVGGAITEEAARLCPGLPSRLWRELDIVCFVFPPFEREGEATEGTDYKVDEESDSVVRKAIE